MSDVKMPKSIPCQFDSGGWSPCKKPTNNGWCTEHEELKCPCCGDKATRSCDAGIGGLACGTPLCANCEHFSGDHVTKKVANEKRREAREEKKARVASRTNPERRMNKELGIPLNLFELLKGDWRAEGYEMGKVYFLELEHGLMGFFPAVFSSDQKRIIFTTSLPLLEKAWNKLPPKRTKLRQQAGYVNRELGLAYLGALDSELEEHEPLKLLTESEFNALVCSEKNPFRWAFGLIGGWNLGEDSFVQDLSAQASKLDPAFVTAKA